MNDPTPVSIIAHAMEQLTDYFRTGRPMPAHRAAVLLARIALDPDADRRLREQGGELARALDRRLAVIPNSSSLHPAWLFGDPDRR